MYIELAMTWPSIFLDITCTIFLSVVHQFFQKSITQSCSHNDRVYPTSAIEQHNTTPTMIAVAVNNSDTHESVLRTRRRSSISEVASASRRASSLHDPAVTAGELNKEFWSALKEDTPTPSTHTSPSSSPIHHLESTTTVGPPPPPKKLLSLQQYAEMASQQLTRIISPNSTFKLTWDILIGMIIIWSVIVIPWKLGFNVPSTIGWIVLDFLFDSLFLIDMVLTFNTGYFEDLAQEVYIDDRAMIAKHYLKTWFTVDILSTIPFDYVASLVSTGRLTNDNVSVGLELRLTKLVRGLRLFRLAKIAVMAVKIKRLRKAAHHHWDINPALFPLLKMIGVILYGLHVLGCGWHFVCTLDEAQMRDNWVGQVRADIVTYASKDPVNSWAAENFRWYVNRASKIVQVCDTVQCN